MTRLLTAIASAIIFCSCHTVTGRRNVITQERHPNQFDGVRSSGSIDVEVMNGDKQMVKVEADDNIMPFVITNVENGMLNVHLRPNQVYHDINVKVYVSAPSLSRLYVSGSGSITSKGSITDEDRIEFKVSGSGDINSLVDAPAITADVSGSGTLKLAGRTKDFNCSVGGSGDLKCKDLLSENTAVSVSGSGNANVFASVSLNAKASGSGNIYYSGNPASPVIHKSGSGSVREE